MSSLACGFCLRLVRAADVADWLVAAASGQQLGVVLYAYKLERAGAHFWMEFDLHVCIVSLVPVYLTSECYSDPSLVDLCRAWVAAAGRVMYRLFN